MRLPMAETVVMELKKREKSRCPDSGAFFWDPIDIRGIYLMNL